jgi:hypothetical protein
VAYEYYSTRYEYQFQVCVSLVQVLLVLQFQGTDTRPFKNWYYQSSTSTEYPGVNYKYYVRVRVPDIGVRSAPDIVVLEDVILVLRIYSRADIQNKLESISKVFLYKYQRYYR